MHLLAAIGLAVGLALDTAAVTASRAVAGRRSFALPWLFGAFHGGMAAIGWMVGRQASAIIQDWDHWIAAGLLAFIGVRMIAARPAPAAMAAREDRLWEILVLAVATSVDAAAAGLAIDTLGVAPALAIGLIAGVCVLLSTVAIPVGAWIGRRADRPMDRIGGVILLAIAVHVVVSHTT
jgi:putative Mn2+ efflux pump MntP